MKKVAYLLFGIFFTSISLLTRAQQTIWVDSCTNYAYRGRIVQPTFMNNTLRTHFVFDNNDAMFIANINIPSPNLPGVDEQRVLIQRVNSNGDSLWSKFIGFAPNVIDSTSFFHTAKQLKNGDIILVFTSLVYDNYGPIFVRLDNRTGNIIWVRQHNLFIGGAGAGFSMSSIMEDKLGDLVCVGTMLFDGLVMKISSTNGDMIFTKRYKQQVYNGFSKVVETESNYMILGGSADPVYSMNLMTAIDKTDGMPLFGYGLDSSSISPFSFENMIYENGILKLNGNTFSYGFNTPYISTYLTIDEAGTVYSFKILKSTTNNSSYYPYSRGNAENYDYKNRVGVASVSAGNQNETQIYRLNETMTGVVWSNIIPYPGTDLFAGLLTTKDSAFVLGGNNMDSITGTTGMMVKTLPNGRMGACPTTVSPAIIIDSTIHVKKALMSYNTFFYLSDLVPPVVSYNASGYRWEVTCNAAQTCKLSAIIGKRVVCKNDTVEYKNRFTDFCIDKVKYFITGTGSTILSTTDSSIRIVFNQTGNFKLLSTIESACGTLKDSITITAKIAVKPTISPVQSICRGDSVTLSITPASFSSYSWSTFAATPQISVIDTGKYSVIVKDFDGCIAYDTTHIQQLLEKPVRFLPNDTTICKYLPIYVAPTASYLQYAWNTGSTQIPLKINRAGLYVLQVKNDSGCFGKDSIQIAENACKQWVRFATAFTPNNDGNNDVWKVYTYGSVEQFSVQIYNRWGQKIFNTTNLNESWNGLYRGAPVPEGTYIIMSRYKLEDEPAQLYKGIIQVIR
jgi:gliding motility-associated-like protein